MASCTIGSGYSGLRNDGLEHDEVGLGQIEQGLEQNLEHHSDIGTGWLKLVPGNETSHLKNPTILQTRVNKRMRLSP